MPGAKYDATAGGRGLIALLTALFIIEVLRSAWIHDDAFITFRTVDNFVHGYGLRWNVVERVQTFTHPLWLFVVAACYSATNEIYFTVIALSVALSTAALLLVVFGAATSTATACLGVAALTLSKAFVEYSTSGLENPLTHVLFAAFLVVYFRWPPGLTLLQVLATLAALASLNRLDTALLYVPALVSMFLAVDRRRGAAMIVAGFMPLLFWEGFSVLYYGFPFPNTAYAKLFETGVGTGERLLHGWYYLLNSVRIDPLTLLVTGAGIAAGATARDRRQFPIACGLAAYLAYVVYIGGDFVTGRFLGVPLLGAVVLLVRRPPGSRMAVIVAACAVLGVGLFARHPPPLNMAPAITSGDSLMDLHGIADERAYYYPFTGFVRTIGGISPANHPWAIEGAAARRHGLPLAIRGDIGLFGFYAGPVVHIIDVWGLADPLIARLPARTDTDWRVGHFTRAIPDGYPATLTSGRNQIANRAVAAYYDRLALLTRGSLFEPGRLAAIWELNTRDRGMHDR